MKEGIAVCKTLIQYFLDTAPLKAQCSDSSFFCSEEFTRHLERRKLLGLNILFLKIFIFQHFMFKIICV
jgi:hypothetical protein